VLAVDGTVYDSTNGKKLGHVNLPGLYGQRAPATPTSPTVTPVVTPSPAPVSAAPTPVPASSPAPPLPPGAKLAPDGITVYDAASGRVLGHLQRKSSIIPNTLNPPPTATVPKITPPPVAGETKRTPIQDCE
jgi:hypothetical protein